MRKRNLISKRVIFSLLVSVFVFIGTIGGAAQSFAASEGSSVTGYIYYVSNDDLYRAKTDGSSTQKIAEDFEGTGAESTGQYLYFMYDDSSTSLQRLSLTDPNALITSFGGDKTILKYLLDGNYIYFIDDMGGLYRSLANAEDDSQITLVADNVDSDFPNITIINGRVYYNALKDGATTWAASKAANGSGNVQWIASGAIQGASLTNYNANTVFLMIDTIPTETEYSLNSMVLYSLPIYGGNPKAANAKSPLDLNAVFSGFWSSNYYLFNKGVKLDADGDYNFATGKAHLIDKNGKIMQLSQTSVIEIAELGNNKLTYVDGKGKAYICTIANGKITGTKALPMTNVNHVRNIKYGPSAGSTVFFTTTDAYVLNADFTLTKMAGVEWDYSVYAENVPGIYYINGKDGDKLYRFSNDGKSKLKLTTDAITEILLISAN